MLTFIKDVIVISRLNVKCKPAKPCKPRKRASNFGSSCCELVCTAKVEPRNDQLGYQYGI